MKSKLVDMLEWFHDFCSENDIRYYIIGGTMLGAARHEGFIPRDDDIDIGNPNAEMKQYVLDKHYMRKHGPNAYYGQK